MIEVNGLVKRFDGFAALTAPRCRCRRAASTAWWVPTAPVSPP